MIEELHISNFRSIVDAEVKLAPLTALVGPNNSGKTNVLRAISFVSDALQHMNPESPHLQPVNISSELFLLNGLSKTGRFTITAKSPVGSFRFVGSPVLRSDGMIVSYECVLEREGPESATPPPPNPRSPRQSRPASPPVPQLGELKKQIAASPIYSFNLRAMRQPCPLGQRPTGMSADGQGLATMLFGMQSKSPDRYELFQEEFSRFVPEVKRINFKEVGQQLTLSYWEKGTKTSHSINDVSDGLVFVTALLALRFAETGFTILLLEEPEQGIHPWRLNQITDALFALTDPPSNGHGRPVQVVLTTHSPYFLERFKNSPESVVIVDRSPSEGTKCRRLSDRPADLQKIREASLGELWFTGTLGGVPAP